VQGLAVRRHFQALNLVLEQELAALEFDDAHIVHGEMVQCLVQFAFEDAMFPLQLNEMRLNRHKKSPSFVDVSYEPEQKIVHRNYDLSTGINATHSNLLLSAQWNESLFRKCERKFARLAPHVLFCHEDGELASRTGKSSITMAEQDNNEYALELARLQQEHRDLDVAIEALHHSPAPDLLRLQRLKKRKLQLRDRISFLEDQITPDIIA
jgi:hypothetical protein